MGTIRKYLVPKTRASRKVLEFCHVSRKNIQKKGFSVNTNWWKNWLLSNISMFKALLGFDHAREVLCAPQTTLCIVCLLEDMP
jgi:hypothetical protein